MHDHAFRPKRSNVLEQVAAIATELDAALGDIEIPDTREGDRVRRSHADLQKVLADLGTARTRTNLDDYEPTAEVAAVPKTDARGYKRSASNTPGAFKGRVPKNKGRLYPPDPPTVTDIVALMRACPDTIHGRRLKALIPFLWRTGLRISEALAVFESDLDPKAGSVVVRKGKGGKRRVVGMDQFGWDMVTPWLEERKDLPYGPVFCVVAGPTAGRAWSDSQVRFELKRLATRAGVRKRIAPHQLRHALAVDIVREGKRLDLLQRQLGHANLGITTTYLASVTNEEVVAMSQDRRPPQLAVPDLLGVLGHAA